MTEHLKTMLQHIIAGRTDEAEATLHDYMQDKMKPFVGIHEASRDPHDKPEMSVLQRMKKILKDKHGYTDSDFEDQTFADIESMFLDDAKEKDFRSTNEEIQLDEGLKAFQKECAAEAAKLLGVASVKTVWTNNKLWNGLFDLDTRGAKKGKTTDVDWKEEDGTETLTVLTPKDGEPFVRGEYNDYAGGDDPHYYVAQ